MLGQLSIPIMIAPILIQRFSVYLISSTLQIPAGTQMVGEAWSVIMGGGSAFSDMSNPTVMVQAGAPGSSGILEITDIVFTTQGPGEFTLVSARFRHRVRSLIHVVFQRREQS